MTHTTEDGVCCTVTPTDITWDAEVTYTIKEIVPDGRHPEAFTGGSGERTVKVKYHAQSHRTQSCINEDGSWSDISYTLTVTDPAGAEDVVTGTIESGDIDPELVYEFKDEEPFTWINDNYRGDLQIVKTLDDQDPFTDKTNSDNGVKKYSTSSKWTIQLKSGGWEEHPYIRVVDEGVRKAAAGEYERYAHVYRAVRDTSGYTADTSAPLTVSEDGQIYVYDLPYGTYTVKEISADVYKRQHQE